VAPRQRDQLFWRAVAQPRVDRLKELILKPVIDAAALIGAGLSARTGGRLAVPRRGSKPLMALVAWCRQSSLAFF
jgi:hypothetical protein